MKSKASSRRTPHRMPGPTDPHGGYKCLLPSPKKPQSPELLNLMSITSTADIDPRLLSEAAFAVMSGHSERAVELFTSERIAWLLDDRSRWLV